ncbi:MAG: hypothetical protein IJ849_02235 [Selenomonadaceae bacterium]|nr:hypothetical protein [Selenomonadaceae bacterium]
MLQKIKKLTQKGQGMIEYILILGFVAVVGAILFASTGIKDDLKSSVDAMETMASAANTSPS